MSTKAILLAQFDFHNRLFNNVVEQITDEESDIHLIPTINNFKWLAGHLTGTQTHFARLGGVSVDFPWADHFPLGPGAPKVEKPATALPAIQEIVAKWNEFHPIIREGLANLPDAALEQKIEMKHPIYPYNDTLGGLWAFINDHAAYTIGQMGILRRGHGKEPMKFN